MVVQQFCCSQSTWRSVTIMQPLNVLNFENKITYSTLLYRLLHPVQRQQNPEGDQGKRTETGYCNKVQIT